MDRSVRLRVAALAVALVAGVGCGDDSGSSTNDAGSTTNDSGSPLADAAVADDAVVDAGLPSPDLLPSGAMLAAPSLPAPPVLTPCRAGWRTIAGAPEDPEICEPWPAPGFARCGPAEAHYPGTDGCAPVGEACPSGPFRDDLPADAHVLHVSSAAAAGGDGSRAAPFATIALAMAAATPGTIVSLAAGDYDEAVVVPAGVDLTGACAARTHVTLSTRDSPPATIVVTGAGATVRNLTISGARSGLLVDTGGNATIRGLTIEGATETGLRVHHSGVADIEDVAIRDVAVDPTDRTSAWGLVVELGGHAEARHVSVERTGPAGVILDSADTALTLEDSVIAEGIGTGARVSGGLGVIAQTMGAIDLRGVVIEHVRFSGMTAALGGRIDGTDVVVRSVTPNPSETFPGNGAQAQPGGHIHLERTRFWNTMTAGFSVVGSDSTFELVDAVIEDTLSSTDGAWGGAGGVGGGATASLTRVLARRNRSLAMIAQDEGTQLALTDVAVLDTAVGGGRSSGGRGIQVVDGASATIERVLVARAANVGFAVFGSGSVTGTDLTVRDMMPDTDPTGFRGMGTGLMAELGIQLDLTRVAISRARGVAVVVANPSTTVVLRDVRVEATQPNPESIVADQTHLGRAVIQQDAASVDIERAILVDNLEEAIEVSGPGTVMVLRDAVIRDTRGEPLTRFGGRGINVVSGAHVTVTQALVERCSEIAIAAFGVGALLELTDVRVLDTLSAECSVDTCMGRGGGIALGSYMGAALRAERFEAGRSSLCGVQVATEGGLDLAHGVVHGSPIGANVQVPGYDLERLSVDVIYRDNERPIDAVELPVPAAPSSVVPTM